MFAFIFSMRDPYLAMNAAELMEENLQVRKIGVSTLKLTIKANPARAKLVLKVSYQVDVSMAFTLIKFTIESSKQVSKISLMRKLQKIARYSFLRYYFTRSTL